MHFCQKYDRFDIVFFSLILVRCYMILICSFIFDIKFSSYNAKSSCDFLNKIKQFLAAYNKVF